MNEYPVLAPILRGALRTDETGPAVVRMPAGRELPDGALSLDLNDCSDVAGMARRAAETFAGIRSAERPAPAYVDAGDAGVFRIEYSGDPSSVARPASGRMEGRIALVTGGAQGFGEEIVRNLCSQGARVYIADLNESKAAELAGELNAASAASEAGSIPVAWAVKADVSDEESVAAMVAEVVEISGGLDLLVNNAGVLRAGSVKSLSKLDFDFVTSINYSAYFLCVKHFSRLLALQNMADGAYFSDIIQINSKSGLQGSNKNAAYAGGKFGGIGLTQSFAMELVEDNIKVNAICPGNFFEGPLWSDPEKGLFVQYLNTGKVPGAKTIEDVKAFYEAKVPMGRGCRGDDVARAIYYAVEQKYETGQAIPVTGGQIMLN
jgi:sorbitol-6-phosphate 2-dehydrogenase